MTATKRFIVPPVNIDHPHQVLDLTRHVRRRAVCSSYDIADARNIAAALDREELRFCSACGSLLDREDGIEAGTDYCGCCGFDLGGGLRRSFSGFFDTRAAEALRTCYRDAQDGNMVGAEDYRGDEDEPN